MNESRIMTRISRYGKWRVEASGRFVYKSEKHSRSQQDVLLFKERMFNGTIRAKVRIGAYNDSEHRCFRFVIGQNCSSGCSYTCEIGGYNTAFVLARTSEISGAVIWRAITLKGAYEARKHFAGKSVEISPRHLAAEQKFASAQLLLALIYNKGDGIKRDSQEAIRWLCKAAQNGNVEAQKLLQSWEKN